MGTYQKFSGEHLKKGEISTELIMAKRRKKSKSKKKKQKYIPIVVLNNRIPVERESRTDPETLPVTPPNIYRRRIVKPKVRNILYYQDERYQRPPRLDRRIGEVFEDYDLGGSNSGSERISG